MTESQRETQKSLFIPLIFLSAMIFLLFQAQNSLHDLRAGLRLCAENVIPSLFPHLILSELFVSNLSFTSESSFLSRAFCRLFRLPKAAAPVILIGAVCGFPIGARLASKLYRDGLLSRKQAEILCAYANNTSPAFVISGVGAALFGSIRLGIIFYICEILASFACLLFTSFFRARIEETDADSSFCAPISFVESVRNASHTMLNICGFVLFFSLANGVICRIFSSASLAFSALLEVTNACKNAALLIETSAHTACFFTAFSIGFGGLSAAMQSALCMKESSVPFGFYLPRKLLQGILSVFSFFLLTEAVAIW